MDELTPLRNLSTQTPVGDEAQVRAAARRALMEAAAPGARLPGRIERGSRELRLVGEWLSSPA